MTKDQGRIIRLSRVKKGWNQQDLGERTGIVQSLISRYENGVRNIPKLDLKKIKRALNLRDEDLMPDADERIFSEILDERRDRRRDIVKKDFLQFLKEIDKLGGKLSEITAGEIDVPVLKDIPAGCPVPIVDAEYIERMEPFPNGWANSERTFGLVIRDGSMDGLGLQAGDTVFVNRDDADVVGQGKVMAVGTTKGLVIRTVVRQGEKYRLIAENPRFETQENSPDDIFIYGTLLKYVIKVKLG